MTAIRTWSERTEPKWRDCTQRSYLMALLYGGAQIPNAYTGAEGERFEDAEGLPESEQELGLVLLDPCDRAARTLYGLAAHDADEAALPSLLSIAGVALALSGIGPGLPGGYLGPHAVCVIPQGNGRVDVYNPLNLMGSDPDGTTASAVLAWHRALPNDIRFVREDEFIMAFDPTYKIGTAVLSVEHSAARVNGGPNVDHIPAGKPMDVFAKANFAGADRYVVIVDGVACGLTVNVDCTFLPSAGPATEPRPFTIKGTVNPDGSITLAS